VLGHAGKQLKLGHGKPQRGVGRACGPAHGPPQPGHDVGQHRADLFLADLFLADLFLADLFLACLFLACLFRRWPFAL
jgi:hypothetical protein